MIRVKYSFLIVVAGLGISIPAWSQENAVDHPVVADEATPVLVTKFYDITLLTTAPEKFSHNGDSAVWPTIPKGVAGGAGGGFGGGGGGGGGGGFFSLPVESSKPGGNDVSYDLVPNQTWDSALKQHLDERGETISDLIMQYVATESWNACGTESGEITEVGNTLIIRQTAPIHRQIDRFLKSLTMSINGKGTYQIEAWWLPTVEIDAMELKTLLSGSMEVAAVLEQLATLCENEKGFHGTLLCRERVATSMASGKKVPVITASQPVVGTGAIGYSPTTRLLHLGLMLEARITSVPDYMVTANDDDKPEQVELYFQSQITGPDAEIQERASFEKVDRYVLSEHRAAGSCRIEIGIPKLISSLTQVSKQGKTDSDVPPELQLVVRVTRTDD